MGLRSVTRVLERVVEAEVTRFDALEKFLLGIHLHRFRTAPGPARVHVSAARSKLFHTGALEERARRFLALEPAPREGDALEVWLRVRNDRVRVSVDASGERLQRRGYRLDGARAPLRETLAAGILLALEWDPTTPLVDPMCGSGTFPIEAALMAANRGPNSGRRFACDDWPGFEPGKPVRAVAAAPSGPTQIVGVDRDSRALAAARDNAQRAEVAVDWFNAAAENIGPGDLPPGLIIANPPYGRRLEEPHSALRTLEAMRERFVGWRLAALWPHDIPRGWSRRLFVRNGGIGITVIERSGS